VYVSSDAVFSGPWVFHAEDSQSFDGSGSAREIRQLESQVLALPNGSVVRSNILGTTADSKSYLDQTVDAILSVQSCRLDATAYASPIAAETFGGILSRIIMQQPRGVLHLSGAERTSPWSFASHLAAVMGSPRNLIQPSAEIQSGTERSLRCSRITSEFGMRLPTMNETLDVVIESLQIPSSLASAA
jgi:dTDP-4-dehydrorhamnose reductase